MIAERIVDDINATPNVGKIEYEAPKLHHTEIEKNLYVAVMSVILGTKMGLERRELISLCMAALLKDIGLLVIDLISKEGKIEPPPRYEHPLVGGRYLMKFQLDTDVAYAVMQHKELDDGTGMPRGLKGEKICLNAKIISIIDTFYEICEKHDPYEDQNKKLENALFKMIQNADKEIIRKFIFNTNIYKVDTLVKLNTGDIAVIAKHNKYNPFRPTVKIIRGNVYKDDELINLRKARSVRLDRVVYYTR